VSVACSASSVFLKSRCSTLQTDLRLSVRLPWLGRLSRPGVSPGFNLTRVHSITVKSSPSCVLEARGAYRASEFRSMSLTTYFNFTLRASGCTGADPNPAAQRRDILLSLVVLIFTFSWIVSHCAPITLFTPVLFTNSYVLALFRLGRRIQ